MLRDYSERRQIPKIQLKPKPRPPVWPYMLLILILVFIAFLLGVGTGWYLYRPGGKFYKTTAPVAPLAPQVKNNGLPPQGEPLAPIQANSPAPPAQQQVQTPHPATVTGGTPPPLTFYKTLQKGGNKELMGTGINVPKEGDAVNPRPAAVPQQPER